MTTCSFCGKVDEDEQPPLTWTSAVEQARTTWICDTSTREHQRAMDSKLESDLC
jgi:hypothetical protein